MTLPIDIDAHYTNDTCPACKKLGDGRHVCGEQLFISATAHSLPSPFHCTRPAGHRGAHIACAPPHHVAVLWPPREEEDIPNA